MIFDASPEQHMLREALQSYLGAAYDLEKRRRIVQSSQGWSMEVWRSFSTDLGILGLGFAPEWGGVGGDGVDQIPVMEALGQSLVVEPYLETVILCGSLLQIAGTAQSQELAAAVIAGEARLALAYQETPAFKRGRISTTATRTGEAWRITGAKSVVAGGAWATHILVVARLGDGDDLGLFVVEQGQVGLDMIVYPTLDGRRACDLTFDVRLPATALLLDQGVQEALDFALDRATAATCAEAVGIMRRLLGETHAYTSERRQFGAPLATFQALQHRMADMLVALELSSGHAYHAANLLDAPSAERSTAVSAAKLFVGKAAHRMGQAAVQLHGGMGMTDELVIGHLFKRAVAIEAQYGSSAYHLQRYRRVSAERALQ